MHAELVVIGAGAAGLWAAGSARKPALILEKTPRTGTKVLASGGTRCNLTTTLDPTAAARLFGAAQAFVTPALRALPPRAVRSVFHRLGVPTVEEPELEKVFPASQRAVDVRDALLRRATAAGATLRTRSPVARLIPEDRGWRIEVGGPDPTVIHAGRVLLCPGGASYPATGTTGDGYAWLEALDLEVVPPVPALVPLTSPEPWVRALSGVAVQDVEARLHDPEGRIVARRTRPVVFTHQGLSGPGAMDLSAAVARAAAGGPSQGWWVSLDLAPRRPHDDLRAALEAAARAPGGPRVHRVLSELGLPARLLAAAADQAALGEPNPAVSRIDRRSRNRLVDAVKGLRVPVDGTLGWEKAEVTAGGLALHEVDPLTMAVVRRPGLWAFGEILDLTGPIGGLNFAAAFATAELAARSATPP